jgi:hypothetical protein
MKPLLIAILIAASALAADPPAITDAQRIAFLKAENALLRKQLNLANEELANIKGADPESEAFKRAVDSLKASCPTLTRTQDGDLVCPAPAK